MFEELVAGNGGWVSYVILGIAIIALGLFFERIWALLQEEKQLKRLSTEILPLVKSHKFNEALDICDSSNSVSSQIFTCLLLKSTNKKSILKAQLEETAAIEIPHLWKNLNAISVIAGISPLLGLLGTVLGMMTAFNEIELLHVNNNASYGPHIIAGGIKEALITTVLGLIVAIPCFISYNFLAGKVEKVTILLEKTSLELINNIIQVKIKKVSS